MNVLHKSFKISSGLLIHLKQKSQDAVTVTGFVRIWAC